MLRSGIEKQMHFDYRLVFGFKRPASLFLKLIIIT